MANQSNPDGKPSVDKPCVQAAAGATLRRPTAVQTQPLDGFDSSTYGKGHPRVQQLAHPQEIDTWHRPAAGVRNDSGGQRVQQRVFVAGSGPEHQPARHGAAADPRRWPITWGHYERPCRCRSADEISLSSDSDRSSIGSTLMRGRIRPAPGLMVRTDLESYRRRLQRECVGQRLHRLQYRRASWTTCGRWRRR